MKIAVVGGGTIGFTAAGHMALEGHDVRLLEFPEFKHTIDGLSDTPVISVVRGVAELELPQGEGALSYCGLDPERALKGADIILVATPAFGEGHAAKVCAPWLRSGQYVFMLAGCMYGSVEFVKRARDHGNREDFTVVEMNNSPYAAKKTGPASVRIGCYKHGVALAAFPGKRGPAALEVGRSLFPKAELWSSPLATGISNPSTGIHATSIIFNPRYVEEEKRVLLYHDEQYLSAIGPAVERVNLDMDRERLQLDGIVGPLKAWRYIFRDWYGYLGVKGEGLLEIMSSNPGLAAVLLPTAFDHRYITEDICMGVWPLVELLERHGLPADVNRSIGHIAASLSGLDLEGMARTLKSLGLDELSNHELEEYLHEGA